MYFYLFHKLNHAIDPLDSKESEGHGARNVRTLLFGGIAYIFTAAFLFSHIYQNLISSVFFLFALRDWFMWFVILDILVMAIIYKKYWGDTILFEVKDAFATKENNDSSMLPTYNQENKEQMD